MAGRGAGKTRAGAEDVSEFARCHPGSRIALVAPTFSDVRNTMVEGESGLLRVLPTSALRGGSVEESWNRSMGEMYLANGVQMQGFSSEKPGRLRGPQHHWAWVDEPAELIDASRGDALDTTWNNLMLGLRLGDDPRVMLTGTPKQVALVRQLLSSASVTVARARTYDNLDNLSPTFRSQVLARYEGTRLGRQELEGELLEDVEGALWQRSWLDEHRVAAAPQLGLIARTVVALDPASGVASGDEQAIVVACLGLDHRYYVLHSEGVRISPTAWLRRAAVLFAHFRADTVIIEDNFARTFGVELFRQVAPELPLRTVNATVGKRTRAEPVSALYEQGKVSHVGTHDDLEDQLCSFTGAPGDGGHDDRLDAMVWAISALQSTGGGPARWGTVSGGGDPDLSWNVMTMGE